MFPSLSGFFDTTRFSSFEPEGGICKSEGGLGKFVSVFKELGEPLRVLSKEKRQVFLDDFRFYLECVVQELKEAHEGTIRTYDSYMQLRRGTVCIFTICSSVELASGVKKENWLPLSNELIALWDEIRDLLIYLNDLYSFKNELYSENDASLVTLCIEKGSDLQGAVDEVIQRFRDSVARFDMKADRILRQYPSEKHADISRYFDSLKTIITGYHTWC